MNEVRPLAVAVLTVDDGCGFRREFSHPRARINRMRTHSVRGAGEGGGGGGRRGVSSFVACRRNLTTDHTPLPWWSTALTPSRNTFNMLGARYVS